MAQPTPPVRVLFGSQSHYYGSPVWSPYDVISNGIAIDKDEVGIVDQKRPREFAPRNVVTDVSVLTPSYRYGHFIADAVMSVLGQEGVSVEHIVQDALSPDETADVLKRFDGRVRWISEQDTGQSDALNRALARARGSWIGWLNADEFYLPGALATLFLQGERTGVDIVYGDCVFVDASGRVDRLVPQHRFSARVLREYGIFISSNAMLMRRASLGDAPWDPTLKRVMDWDLHLGLLSRGARFAHVRYPVGAFRSHGESITSEPPEDDHEENVVARRYGLPKDMVEGWKASRAGRWMHPAYKLVDGAYVRQLKARFLHGRGLRWFSDPAGEETCAALLRRCYGLSVDRADGHAG